MAQGRTENEIDIQEYTTALRRRLEEIIPLRDMIEKTVQELAEQSPGDLSEEYIDVVATNDAIRAEISKICKELNKYEYKAGYKNKASHIQTSGNSLDGIMSATEQILASSEKTKGELHWYEQKARILGFYFKEKGILGAIKRHNREALIVLMDGHKRDISRIHESDKDAEKRLEKKLNKYLEKRNKLRDKQIRTGKPTKQSKLDKLTQKENYQKTLYMNKIRLNEYLRREHQKEIDILSSALVSKFEKTYFNFATKELMEAVRKGEVRYNKYQDVYIATDKIDPIKFSKLTWGKNAVDRTGKLIHEKNGKFEHLSAKEVEELVRNEIKYGKTKIYTIDPDDPQKHIREILNDYNDKRRAFAYEFRQFNVDEIRQKVNQFNQTRTQAQSASQMNSQQKEATQKVEPQKSKEPEKTYEKTSEEKRHEMFTKIYVDRKEADYELLTRNAPGKGNDIRLVFAARRDTDSIVINQAVKEKVDVKLDVIFDSDSIPFETRLTMAKDAILKANKEEQEYMFSKAITKCADCIPANIEGRRDILVAKFVEACIAQSKGEIVRDMDDAYVGLMTKHCKRDISDMVKIYEAIQLEKQRDEVIRRVYGDKIYDPEKTSSKQMRQQDSQSKNVNRDTNNHPRQDYSRSNQQQTEKSAQTKEVREQPRQKANTYENSRGAQAQSNQRKRENSYSRSEQQRTERTTQTKEVSREVKEQPRQKYNDTPKKDVVEPKFETKTMDEYPDSLSFNQDGQDFEDYEYDEYYDYEIEEDTMELSNDRVEGVRFDDNGNIAFDSYMQEGTIPSKSAPSKDEVNRDEDAPCLGDAD